MRAISICAAMCLSILPGRAGAEVTAAAKPEPETARLAETIYYPPAYGDYWQRPWADNGYRRWLPRAPYPGYAPRYPNSYGSYAYRNQGRYQPRYGNTWQYRWPARPPDSYAGRTWPAPSQPGYTWNQTPDYRWAGTVRPRTYADAPGYWDRRRQRRW